MNNTLENVDFQVNIKLNNGEAIFSYTKNGEPATGGGVVSTETAGNYNLDDATIQNGFVFTGATITDIDTQKPCAQDFSYKVSDNGHTIIITDTDENNGSVCLIFNVECNGKKYESADPQVKNEKEL
ncbi:DP-EP family protein [Pseudoalteromonas sp. NZS71_1]|uniref:DP-EP family protein n=1 Tax=Pseudoalteromonas sp. NZS71_1 TaxID=2792072 RepID=UPI0018CFC325|nr:DP-EP family protein [Pseudoalteromonas sp. NZS71_1]MBH0033843.1 DP-EP family protein [Pseudoalteromonas sp. NZS71_1]